MELWPWADKVVDVVQVLNYLRSDCYLPKKAAAAYLGWGVRKLESCQTEIPHYRHRGRVYFKRSDLDRYMAGFEVQVAVSEEFKLRELARKTKARMDGN